ncbi:hypothetical protein ACJX0J_030687, partial [Zea mays]
MWFKGVRIEFTEVAILYSRSEDVNVIICLPLNRRNAKYKESFKNDKDNILMTLPTKHLDQTIIQINGVAHFVRKIARDIIVLGKHLECLVQKRGEMEESWNKKMALGQHLVKNAIVFFVISSIVFILDDTKKYI